MRVAAETVPIENETAERVVRTVVFGLPPAALVAGGWMAWGGALNWNDLVVLGSHLRAHGPGHHGRLPPALHPPQLQDLAPGARRPGGAGLDGGRGPGDRVGVDPPQAPLLFRSRRATPTAPISDELPGWRGALRGLGHAHVGWMFRGKDMANPARYARDLVADRDLRFISRTFPLWVAVGLAVPFGLGVALTGSLVGGLTGLLWGGAVRIFLLHHVTFSINSLCHYFGRRPFSTGDESRNLAWLAPLSFGEAWHNNHHAFPTSAAHGLRRWQIDPGAWLISSLERCHLAWDVVRITPERQQAPRGVS